MEKIRQRYNNFICFLDVRVKDNEYVEDLKKIDYLVFITALRKRIIDLELDKLPEEEAVEKAYEQIINKTGIDIKSFKDDDVDKFKRYLLYFLSISKIVLN